MSVFNTKLITFREWEEFVLHIKKSCTITKLTRNAMYDRGEYIIEPSNGLYMYFILLAPEDKGVIRFGYQRHNSYGGGICFRHLIDPSDNDNVLPEDFIEAAMYHLNLLD
jgi:hypothetical protein